MPALAPRVGGHAFLDPINEASGASSGHTLRFCWFMLVSRGLVFGFDGVQSCSPDSSCWSCGGGGTAAAAVVAGVAAEAVIRMMAVPAAAAMLAGVAAEAD